MKPRDRGVRARGARRREVPEGKYHVANACGRDRLKIGVVHA